MNLLRPEHAPCRDLATVARRELNQKKWGTRRKTGTRSPTVEY